MDINELISKKLKGLRAENSYSLDDVANRIGLHRETVRRYENNPYIMSIDILLKILELYQVNVNVFFEEIYGKMPYINK